MLYAQYKLSLRFERVLFSVVGGVMAKATACKSTLKKGSKLDSKVNIEVPATVVDLDTPSVEGIEAPTEGVPKER